MAETEASTNTTNAEAPTEHEAVHAIVHGAVQGVGFRYFTQMNAQRVGVVGWVRNREDGTVEVYAEGTAKRLRQLISALNRGPTHAHVARVEVTWTTPAGEARSFHIRY